MIRSQPLTAHSRAEIARSQWQTAQTHAQIVRSHCRIVHSRGQIAGSHRQIADSRRQIAHSQRAIPDSPDTTEKSRSVNGHSQPARADSPGAKSIWKEKKAMDDNQRRRLDKFNRETAFINDNAADFAASSPGRATADQLAAVIADINRLAAQQVSGADDSNRHFDNKQDALDDLLDLLRQINRAASAMTDEVPNLESKFRLPRNRSQQNLLATARSFQTDAAPYVAQFTDYDLAPDFLSDLEQTIAAVESFDTTDKSARTSRAEATGGLVSLFQRGMALSE